MDDPARGDRVFAAVRRTEALSDLARRFDGALVSLLLSLTDPESIRKAIAMAFEETGRIDAIEAAAGYGLSGAAEELTDAQIERQVKVALLRSMQPIRATLPFLCRQGGARNGAQRILRLNPGRAGSRPGLSPRFRARY
ncbi:MAG: SDR family NAD(P)-dependent oxidoreductase [Rhodobacteraceae bacterium]|nr:SDR family NAD(P)-dependent oxidoreductase [Paracoccaceae bacterium]